MFASIRPFLITLRQAFAIRADLLIENLALRHQLAIYQRQETQPQLREQDRRIWTVLSRLWPHWRDALVMVQTDTVVRWHHRAWKRYWSFKSLWGCGASKLHPNLKRGRGSINGTRQLGHATIGVTADTYAHVTAELQRDAANRVSELIWPSKESRG